MMPNAIDLRTPSNVMLEINDVLARVEALISTAILLGYEMDNPIFIKEDRSYKYDRLVYQLEAIKMFIDERRALFSDAEVKLLRLEFTEKQAASDLADAA